MREVLHGGASVLIGGGIYQVSSTWQLGLGVFLACAWHAFYGGGIDFLSGGSE